MPETGGETVLKKAVRTRLCANGFFQQGGPNTKEIAQTRCYNEEQD
jgi:hypothetical protein